MKKFLEARSLAYQIRNSMLEDIHGGKILPEKYMKEYSRITEPEMREIMLMIERKIMAHLGFMEDVRAQGKEKMIYEGLQRMFENGVSWDKKEVKSG